MALPVLRPAWPRTRPRQYIRLAERGFDKLCRRRRYFAIFIVGFLSFLLSELTAIKYGIAPPIVHDEYAYLLAADTFAQGRLTNPPHPFWEHFESIHIIQQPTYSSMYPPAQGMAIAVGQVLTGYPIAGVWLSMAVACSLLTWMLWAYVPPRWAFVGGCLAVIQFGFVSSWTRSYWGGAVAFAGGALLYGALRRLVNDRWLAGKAMHIMTTVHPWWRDAMPTMRNSVLFALGLLILANSRPFEGFIISVPALVVLGITIFRRIKASHLVSIAGETRYIDADGHVLTLTGSLTGAPGAVPPTGAQPSPGGTAFGIPAIAPTVDLPPLTPSPRRVAISALAPMLVLLVLGGVWMLYFNYRVTGNPLKMPWQLHHDQYCVFPAFVWGSPDPAPAYRHADIEYFHTKFELGFYTSNFEKGFSGFIDATWSKLMRLYNFYFGWLLLIAALAGVALWRNRWLRFALLAVGVLWLANLCTVVVFSHYAAPSAALAMLIVVLGLRRWMLMRFVGPALVFAVLLLVIPVAAMIPTEVPSKAPRWDVYRMAYLSTSAQHRQTMLSDATLNHSLILVRRPPGVAPSVEWVYNDADIDASPIVWAREMGPVTDRPLIEYYLKQHRSILLFEPYAGESQPGRYLSRMDWYPIERLGLHPSTAPAEPEKPAPQTQRKPK